MANGDPLYGPREWRRDDGTTVVAGRAAEPVPPVTDNERDEWLGCALAILDSLCEDALEVPLSHAYGLNRDGLLQEYAQSCDFFALAVTLARLVAALSAATTERDEWKHDYYHDVAAHYDAKIAAERRAEALAAQLQQAREALSWALDSLELAFKRLDSVDEYSPEHYLIRQAGFDKARAALAAAAPATTLTEPEGEG